ncbi:type IV toxin-antitoxin system AbiEi family antitoxin domain-containing protein [Agromyces tropicus]|uniref:Type IV toxin-antitoxin system AbiEi family antitoxin domain-containing protein n=1 Tax=Agromyces tropicus TaxID=555371 RepID=A0ABP5GEV5_9MICO
MPGLFDELSRLGHVARASTLIAGGVDRRQISREVARGAVIRPRRDWIAAPSADGEQLAAVASGAVIGCVSALRRLGVWAGEDDVLHLHAPPSAGHVRPASRSDRGGAPRVWHPLAAHHRRRADGVRPAVEGAPRVHWAPDPAPERAFDWIVSPEAALARAVRCLPEEHARAAVDSVLHERVLTRLGVDAVLAGVATTRVLVDEHTGRLESGVESLFVRRLVDAGHSVRPQVRFPNVGRFDGLIDDVVLFEIDGRAHHSGPEEFHRDRDRTLVGHAFGVPVVRPSARHVLEDWPTVIAAVTRAVADAAIVRASRGLPPAFD